MKSVKRLLLTAAGAMLVGPTFGSVTYKDVTIPSSRDEATSMDYVTLVSQGSYYQDSPFGTNAYGRTKAGVKDQLHWSDDLPAASGKKYFGEAARTITGASTWNHDPTVNRCLFAGDRFVLAPWKTLSWKTVSPYFMEFPELYVLENTAFENGDGTYTGDLKLAGKLVVLSTESKPLTMRPSYSASNVQGFNLACTLDGPDTASIKVCPRSDAMTKGYTRGYLKVTGNTDDYLGSLTVESNDLYVASCGLKNCKSVALTNTAMLAPLAAADETATVANLSADATCSIVLSITNTLVLTGTVSLDPAVKVSLSRLATWSPSSSRVEILRVPAGTGIDAHLTAHVGYTDDWRTYKFVVETDDAGEHVYCAVQEVVTQVLADSAGPEGVLQSAMTNAAAWSDGQEPHTGANYLSALTNSGDRGLRTLHEDKKDPTQLTMPKFPGQSLTIGSEGIFSLCQSYFTVDTFRMFTGTKLYYKNNFTERLYGSLELIGTPDEFVTVRAYYYTVNGTNELNSDLSGEGSIQFVGNPGSGVPQGILKIQGNNTNWFGRLWVRMGGSSATAGRECPNTTRYQICYVTNNFNFGGAFSAFDYQAVRLSEYGTLAVETGLNVALGVPNRGLWVEGNGQLLVVGTGVFSISNDVTYAGELRKIGAGRLALGGTARFGAKGQSATPSAGQNVLDVVEGSLQPISSTCLDGVATTFRSGTSLVYDLDTTDETLRKTGIRLVKDGSAFAPESGLEKIPVAFSTSRTRILSTETLALVTGSETLCNTLKEKISVPSPCAHAVVMLSVATDSATGLYTLLATVSPKGLCIIYR